MGLYNYWGALDHNASCDLCNGKKDVRQLGSGKNIAFAVYIQEFCELCCVFDTHVGGFLLKLDNRSPVD